jgi:hypothetical protein
VLGSGGFDAFALGCLQDLLIERRERLVEILAMPLLYP